jgi:trimeric autotransporter adhesin
VKLRACFVIVCFLSAAICTTQAQTAASNSSPTSTQVPRLIKFSGLAQDESRKPVTSVVGITFSLYKDQQGGSPLWVETQNVQADATGHYTAMLGSASANGVPLSLFSSGEAHWISTQISGHAESARVLLLSVPYALKAADAETLGGLPASAFMHANPGGVASTAGSQASAPGTLPPTAVTGKGTKNYVPIWTGAETLGNSMIYEAGGNVGIGTKTPKAPVDVVGTGTIAIQATAPGTEAAISGTATATSGGTTGVYGQSSDPNGNGVFGIDKANTGGSGVIGVSNATSGKSSGVFGQSASTAGTGVFGNVTAKTGGVFGVLGMAGSTGQYSAGVSGVENAATGAVAGVAGKTSSVTSNAAGVAGFEGSATGQVFGVSGGTNSTTNFAAGVSGFEGATTGQVFGVNGGTSSTGQNAAGVSGTELATTGQVFGVNGYNVSTGQYAAGVNGNEAAMTGQVFGVSGETSSTTNFAVGVNGYESAATGQVFGVNGGTNSTTAFAAGVNGYENATTGQVFGVIGTTTTTGDNAAGVYGQASAATGLTRGVIGETDSATDGAVGVFGYGRATTGQVWGVVGQTSSPSGAGGIFTNLSGGKGLVLVGNGKNLAQVFTVDASGNGFYAGNLTVKGNVSKGGGSFKIDHPLDPANKYLSHSFVESPDMMNVYNGNITTDRHGFATVNLPDYFEALNGDFRYQLTVIGQFAQAIVAEKISANRFVIRTNKPNVEVSWQVTGVRHDAYANRYRIPVEEDKALAEQGYYLHPEVFGQPESKSISAAGRSAPASQEVMADAAHK